MASNLVCSGRGLDKLCLHYVLISNTSRSGMWWAQAGNALLRLQFELKQNRLLDVVDVGWDCFESITLCISNRSKSDMWRVWAGIALFP